ncbi:MAG: ribosome recycling factor [Clostridia bacterium]|jgi:ribosome recycling factor|nr:ribosome recycling factor [Clostridia bacterium]
MNIDNLQVKNEFEKYESRISKALEHLKSELLTVRAGRANPQILNKIVVDYYGTPTPLNQMANITVPDARTLMISLWDTSMLKEVSKVISASDIGINPSDDGKNIRLVFPQLTEERRKELCKQIKKTAEDSKVVLRNERRDILEAVKRLKKDNGVTEDEVVVIEKEVQKILDKAIESADKFFKEKEAEILEV